MSAASGPRKPPEQGSVRVRLQRTLRDRLICSIHPARGRRLGRQHPWFLALKSIAYSVDLMTGERARTSARRPSRAREILT